MQVCHGKSVFGGIAIGKLWVFAKKEHQIVRVKVQNPEEELARFEKAKEEKIVHPIVFLPKKISPNTTRIPFTSHIKFPTLYFGNKVAKMIEIPEVPPKAK